jgi:hypothetical protein
MNLFLHNENVFLTDIRATHTKNMDFFAYAEKQFSFVKQLHSIWKFVSEINKSNQGEM